MTPTEPNVSASTCKNMPKVVETMSWKLKWEAQKTGESYRAWDDLRYILLQSDDDGGGVSDHDDHASVHDAFPHDQKQIFQLSNNTFQKLKTSQGREERDGPTDIDNES